MGVLRNAGLVLVTAELPELEWWQKLPVVPTVIVVALLTVLRGIYIWWNGRDDT